MILALARVSVAAAWADGELHGEEIDSLKDLLFHLPHVGPARGVELPAADWARLDMYIQSPVDAAERNRLIAELQAALRTPADREANQHPTHAAALPDAPGDRSKQAMRRQERGGRDTLHALPAFTEASAGILRGHRGWMRHHWQAIDPQALHE